MLGRSIGICMESLFIENAWDDCLIFIDFSRHCVWFLDSLTAFLFPFLRKFKGLDLIGVVRHIDVMNEESSYVAHVLHQLYDDLH
jgi:hypothetical protein